MLFKEAKNPLTILVLMYLGGYNNIDSIAVLAELKVNENYSVGG